MSGVKSGFRHAVVATVAAIALAACAPGQRAGVRSAPPALKLVTWNLEHLAEADGTGCRPRGESDYAALRSHVEKLNADVIAFEEVETARAAARVFSPDRYTIEFSERPMSERHGPCNAKEPNGKTIRQQDVGFAIRKGVAYTRHADLRELGLGNPDLRWGVDVTISGKQPLRLLAVHLKSGCFDGDHASACPVLQQQIPVLTSWVAGRVAEHTAFAVLGDWNRHIDSPGDALWQALSQQATLTSVTAGRHTDCEARFPEFIDHLVFDASAAKRIVADSFQLYTYGVPEAEHPSDHCPVAVTLH
ncbi:MAG: endonuclease/exonuclease/phosphatase family protein [Tahibacter sp.]